MVLFHGIQFRNIKKYDFFIQIVRVMIIGADEMYLAFTEQTCLVLVTIMASLVGIAHTYVLNAVIEKPRRK